MLDTNDGSAPQRPNDPVSRREVLLREILATRRVQKRPWLTTFFWMLVFLVYLLPGLTVMFFRFVALFVYTLLGATVLSPCVSGWVGQRIVFPLLGFRIKINNVNNLNAAFESNAFFVMVLNHVSYVDSPLLASLIGRVSRKGYTLLASTLMGGQSQWELLKRLGLLKKAVYTQSTAATPEERERTRSELLSLARKSSEEGDVLPLVVFPEGQVHDCTRYLLRYEKFCFGIDAPVLPVAIEFRQPWPVNFWVVGDNPLVSFAFLLFVPFVTWEYHVGKLDRAQEDETDGAFAKRIQHQMGNTLSCQPTDFRLTDVGEVIDYLAQR